MNGAWIGIGIGIFAALTAFMLWWACRTTPSEKKRAAEVEKDKADGWEYVSNSRFGRSMFLCPICKALTVHESKIAHLAWHASPNNSARIVP